MIKLPIPPGPLTVAKKIAIILMEWKLNGSDISQCILNINDEVAKEHAGNGFVTKEEREFLELLASRDIRNQNKNQNVPT